MARVLLFSPILVAVVVMLPRLLSAQFGLLDDGITLRLARAFPEQWRAMLVVSPDSGRFRPAYAWFFGVVHTMTGPRPLMFFVVNLLLLAAITAVLIGFVRALGGTRLQAWAAGVLFVLSGATAESFYTLSKPEPIQLLWTMLALVLVVRSGRASGPVRSVALFVAATAALLIAGATKETTVVMIPIGLGWLVGAWWVRTSTDRPELAIRARCLLMSIAAGGVFFALRASLGGPALAEGGYTRLYRLEWSNIGNSLGDWMILLARDYSYLLPLVAALIALSVMRGQAQRILLLDSVVWMVGWMAVCLPWSWTLPYFMLPFALGAAAFAGVAFGQIVDTVRSAVVPGPRRVAAAGLVGFAVLWPMNLVNSASMAAVQLAVDAANHDLVRFAATLPRGVWLGVNLPAPNEYVPEIGIHLADLEGRPDVVVDYLDPPERASERPRSPAYVVAPQMQREPVRSVRIGFNEAGTINWDRRLERMLGEDRTPVYVARRAVRLLGFNLHHPMCWLLKTVKRDVCAGARGPFTELRAFSYGWAVYRLPDREAEVKSP